MNIEYIRFIVHIDMKEWDRRSSLVGKCVIAMTVHIPLVGNGDYAWGIE